MSWTSGLGGCMDDPVGRGCQTCSAPKVQSKRTHTVGLFLSSGSHFVAALAESGLTGLSPHSYMIYRFQIPSIFACYTKQNKVQCNADPVMSGTSGRASELQQNLQINLYMLVIQSAASNWEWDIFFWSPLSGFFGSHWVGHRPFPHQPLD